MCRLKTSVRVFSKVFCSTWTVGCQNFGQYIRMLCPGRFILIDSVCAHCYVCARIILYVLKNVRNFYFRNQTITSFWNFSPCILAKKWEGHVRKLTEGRGAYYFFFMSIWSHDLHNWTITPISGFPSVILSPIKTNFAGLFMEYLTISEQQCLVTLQMCYWISWSIGARESNKQ